MITRKSANKSNIGILEGKDAKYNEQILEILFKEGCLTPWEIAKKIRENNYPISPDIETRSRRIYSVIQRKKGRLQDLKVKGYVSVKDKNWELTLKGAIVALILEPNLINHLHSSYSTIRFVLGKNAEPSKLDEIASELLSDLARKTNKCLNKGIINLDLISQDNLVVILTLLEKEGFDESNIGEGLSFNP